MSRNQFTHFWHKCRENNLRTLSGKFLRVKFCRPESWDFLGLCVAHSSKKVSRPSKAGGIGQFTSRIKSVGRTSLLQLECLHWAPVSLSSLRDWFPCLFTFSPRAFLRFAPDNWCQRESGAQWIAIGYRSHRVKHVYLGTQSTHTDFVFQFLFRSAGIFTS